VLEKVQFALRNLGFESAQARRAVLEVQKAHGEPPPLERALREALLIATARFV
jgi:Holliday junction resolvasome RuvABC DNA-binding subunit